MKFALIPENSNYSVQPGSEILSVQLDGGFTRDRLDVLNAAYLVVANFKTDLEGYTYIMAFYRSIAMKGTVPFEIDLILNKGELTEYTAKFVKDSVKLTAQKGHTYWVASQLQVMPPYNPTELDDDTTIVEDYNDAHGITP